MVHSQTGDEIAGGIKLPCPNLPEAVPLQASDLLGSGQPFFLPPFQAVDEQGGKPGVFHGIGQDATFFQEGKLFLRRWSHLPREGRCVACQVFCGNGERILYGVYQFFLPAPHFFQLLGKSRLPFFQHIPLGLFLCIDEVYFLIVFQLFVNGLGDFLVLGDKGGWLAQVVPLRHPKKIQKQKMVFSRKEPHSPSHHLLIQAPHLGWTKHHHTIHRWAIPAFRQEHCVAENIVFAVFKIRENICPIDAVPIDFHSPHAKIA